MSEAIPEDVTRAVVAACNDLDRFIKDLGRGDFTELQRVVGSAIMTERLRCLQVAASVSSDCGGDVATCQEIAERILGSKGEA